VLAKLLAEQDGEAFGRIDVDLGDARTLCRHA
jgi:hypothetical protein